MRAIATIPLAAVAACAEAGPDRTDDYVADALVTEGARQRERLGHAMEQRQLIGAGARRAPPPDPDGDLSRMSADELDREIARLRARLAEIEAELAAAGRSPAAPITK